MLCIFDGNIKGTKCSLCGYTLKQNYRHIPVRKCGNATIGLGDMLEYELTRMGITQDRYKEIKERFGFPPTCGCEKRKQWLNKVGRYIGI